MNFGGDWMVTEMTDDYVVRDGSKNYYHEKSGRCDDWRVGRIEGDYWTKGFVRSDCSRMDG